MPFNPDNLGAGVGGFDCVSRATLNGIVNWTYFTTEDTVEVIGAPYFYNQNFKVGDIIDSVFVSIEPPPPFEPFDTIRMVITAVDPITFYATIQQYQDNSVFAYLFGTTYSTVGGSAVESFTLPGGFFVLPSTAMVQTTVKSYVNPVQLMTSSISGQTLTMTFTGDPGAGTQVYITFFTGISS